jgi:hypothetical protein
LIKYVKYTGCYGSPRPPMGLVKITFFLFIIFPQILPNKVKIKYNLDPKIHTAHVFTHPLITKHEKRITRLKYSNEKQEKLLVLE